MQCVEQWDLKEVIRSGGLCLRNGLMPLSWEWVRAEEAGPDKRMNSALFPARSSPCVFEAFDPFTIHHGTTQQRGPSDMKDLDLGFPDSKTVRNKTVLYKFPRLKNSFGVYVLKKHWSFSMTVRLGY
jgi:hypothetical protein